MKLNNKCTEEKLVLHGFKKCGSVYKRTVPLYKYKKTSIIEAIFTTSIDGKELDYEVTDSYGIYIPFYNSEYSDQKRNLVLKKVKKILNAELEKLKEVEIIEQ